jgi:2-polyprenyl-3-methyl-5-hydroxy-6-metoxy-1,4-benzoquinol methylase
MMAADARSGLTRRVCPSCEAEAPSRTIGKKLRFTWKLCMACGTRFVERRPTPEEIARLYEAYYRAENLRVPDFVMFRLAEIVSGFSRYRRTGRLLDVGFGAGALLTAAEAAGWTCWGTEVAPQSLQVGQERGWRVVPGDLLGASLPEEAFDVVCMTEVLEHLEDPMSYVREVSRLLRPGGLFYATTPNGAGVNSRMLGTGWTVFSAPEHLQLFCPASAGALLERAHYARCRIRTEGLNPSELHFWRIFHQNHGEVDRVKSGYALNQRLSSGRGWRSLKRAANRLINLSQMGDTLKIYAEKSICAPRPRAAISSAVCPAGQTPVGQRE